MRRVVAAFAGATLVAGIVGALRQRAEARAAARGEAPRGSAVVDDPPATPYGPLARRLASWVPPPPSTPVGRAAAWIWASPLTVVGLAVAAVAGAPLQWDAEQRCFVLRGARGPSRVALGAVGAQANAIGHVVLSTLDDPSPALLAHEAVHVRQAERLGPLLFVLYLWLGARYGYRDHPLERAARRGARAAG